VFIFSLKSSKIWAGDDYSGLHKQTLLSELLELANRRPVGSHLIYSTLS
jgi:hypothetical protein